MGAQLDPDELAAGVRAGDRTALGRALTLVESDLQEHRAQAQQLLDALLPETGGATRLGVSGLPGAGKSTLIDALGTLLTGRGHRVAVLAVDPSSSISGGSILGDKTRMGHLAKDDAAFIRPSPSSGTLGGVARKTRESMLVCEAAGFDVVIVETVGVGQSEAVVADMVDTFLVLTLTGGGDELQGIKRGILELADVIAINKADGDNVEPAKRARKELHMALKLMRGSSPWVPPVVLCSARERTGLDDLWDELQRHRSTLEERGELDEKRRNQKVRWMWRIVEDRLVTELKEHPAIEQRLAEIEQAVRDGETAPSAAAETLLAIFREG
ncbi:MAG: methylmalonyl Co-A mutase-associated GTPase MeaB [Polyangiales bacterium]